MILHKNDIFDEKKCRKCLAVLKINTTFALAIEKQCSG
mgnify:CR=1 FL=1